MSCKGHGRCMCVFNFFLCKSMRGRRVGAAEGTDGPGISRGQRGEFHTLSLSLSFTLYYYYCYYYYYGLCRSVLLFPRSPLSLLPGHSRRICYMSVYAHLLDSSSGCLTVLNPKPTLSSSSSVHARVFMRGRSVSQGALGRISRSTRAYLK